MLKEEGQKVAKFLQFNEETTRRRLIDQALVAAGWNVGADGANTEQVRQEVRVRRMQSPSGEGFADYVLYGDDGKPLAVIEAKKTAKDSHAGAEQARIYAGCLEKETGVRPVIFFTNGVDIFLWDDVQGYPYRKVYGFYSKDSLEYLVHQRSNKKLDKRVFSPRANAQWGQDRAWIENAEKEHQIQPFHAIIATSPTGQSHVLDGANVDDGEPLWRVEAGQLVLRDSAVFVAKLHLLLTASARVVIIDPFFCSDTHYKTGPLVAFCNLLRGRATLECLELLSPTHVLFSESVTELIQVVMPPMDTRIEC